MTQALSDHTLKQCDQTTSLVAYLLTILINGYQLVVSPLLGTRCRFYPTCSDYAKTCLQKYSLHKALLKISYRLLRCQPLCTGGVDLP